MSCWTCVYRIYAYIYAYMILCICLSVCMHALCLSPCIYYMRACMCVCPRLQRSFEYDSILRFTIYCGAYRIGIPTPNAATRGLQHRSVAVGPQTVRMLLGGLIHLRSSQPEWLLEVAPQLRSRQVLAPAYLSRALYPPGFIICNVGPHAHS